MSRISTYNREELLLNVTFRWDQEKQQFVQRKVDDENSKVRIIGNFDWNDIINKPSQYPPEYHTHTTDDIISFQPFERLSLVVEQDIDPFTNIQIPDGKTYDLEKKNLLVIRDGIVQKQKENQDDTHFDYIEVDNNHIQFNYKIFQGSVIEFIITRLPPSLTRQSVYVSSPIPEFTPYELPDNVQLRVNGGNLLIIRDGIIQKPRINIDEEIYDYIEVDEKTIMFSYSIPEGSILDFIVLNIFS